MKTEPKHPNPAGKAGKPFTLAPHTFDEALRKILSAAPEPKSPKPKPKKKQPHVNK
jgi:hypothetical protein